MNKCITAFILPVFLVCFVQFSIIIPLASLPQWIIFFNTTHAKAGAMGTLFMLGLTVSPIFWGYIIDHWNIKKILMLCVAICFLCDIIFIGSRSINIYLVSKLVQGICAGCLAVSARSLVRSLLSKEELALAYNYLYFSVIWAVILGPLIGSYFVTYFGWKSIYIFLAAFAVVIFILLSRYPMPQAMNVEIKSVTKLVNVLLDFIKNKTFIVYSFARGMIYAAILFFMSITTYIFTEQLHFHLTSYGWINLGVGVGYTLGLLFSRFLVTIQILPSKIIRYNALAMLLCLIILCFMTLSSEHIIFYLSIFFMCMFFNGVISANCSACSMGSIDNYFGIAAAFMLVIQSFCGFIASRIASSKIFCTLAVSSYILLSFGIIIFILVMIGDNISSKR